MLNKDPRLKEKLYNIKHSYKVNNYIIHHDILKSDTDSKNIICSNIN